MTEACSVLAPLALVWALAVILPGPNFLVIVWMGASRGRAAALATAAGVLTGAAFWVAAGLFGLKALFTALPFAGVAIKLAGALCLIWFGLQLVLERRSATEVPDGAKAGAAYRAGLATTLANPKSAAVAASLLAAALPVDAPAILAPEAFVVLLAISSAWYLTLAIVSSHPAMVRRVVAVRRRLAQAAGVAFVLFGVKLAIER
jgi:threonine/homoserine/homoserine lactone efflux protein